VPINIDEFDTPQKRDFRRANGAPMIVDKEGKNQRLSRPSGWGKILDDENALVNWKIDRAAIGVATDPALQARYVAVKDGDREALKGLRELAINAGRGAQAADIGTALHAMSERWEDPEDDFDPPEEYAKSLRVYSKTLEEFGLVSELFEYHVVNLKRGCAGTADRLYRTTREIVTPDGEIHPPGTLFVGDLKTGKSLDFSLPGYTVQMALYAEGELYDVDKDEFLPTPPINRDWGILVHLPAGQEVCSLIWCDMGVGEWGAGLVADVKQWRRLWKNVEPYGAYEFTPPIGLSVEEAADALEGVDIVDTDELVVFIRLRIAAIKRNPDAAALMIRRWPEGVPTPKNGLSDPAHIQLVLTLLDNVEAEHGLTWPIGDPRTSKPHTKKENPK
jgi:hypothetical protein